MGHYVLHTLGTMRGLHAPAWVMGVIEKSSRAVLVCASMGHGCTSVEQY